MVRGGKERGQMAEKAVRSFLSLRMKINKHNKIIRFDNMLIMPLVPNQYV